MEKTLRVSGMHCRSCEMLISDSVSEIKGVERVSADGGSGLVKVSIEDESLLDQVKKVIEKEGYKVVG